MSENNKLILGLDVSTKTIGIALFEDLGDKTIYDEFDLGFTITGIAL